MATIRKRNGRFQAQVRLRGRPSITRTFLRKAEAVAWTREQESRSAEECGEVEKTILPLITFGELLERYYDEVLSKRSFYQRELSIVKNFRKSSMYFRRIAQLTEGHVAEYRDKRLKDARPATVVRELAIASHCMTTATTEWGYKTIENHFRKIRKPKFNNERDRRLGLDEWKRIIDVDEKRGRLSIRYVIEFAIETAMRQSELLRLEIAHINFSQRTLYIPITKNGYPRTIPLTPRAVQIAIEIIGMSQNKFLFPIACRELVRRWKLILRRANIRNLRWHDLRHEGISRHFENGLNVPEVALISGHRDYKILQRYTHIRPENVAAKLARLSAPSE